MKVYRTAVRPGLLCDLETAALTRRQEAGLEVAELKLLRFALGAKRMDAIKYEYVRDTVRVGCLGDNLRESTLRLV